MHAHVHTNTKRADRKSRKCANEVVHPVLETNKRWSAARRMNVGLNVAARDARAAVTTRKPWRPSGGCYRSTEPKDARRPRMRAHRLPATSLEDKCQSQARGGRRKATGVLNSTSSCQGLGRQRRQHGGYLAGQWGAPEKGPTETSGVLEMSRVSVWWPRARAYDVKLFIKLDIRLYVPSWMFICTD